MGFRVRYGFPLWAVWCGGLVAELLLNGLQFLSECFHLLSQGLCFMGLGFGCAGPCWRSWHRRGPRLWGSLPSGRCCGRRLLQHLIIDGDESIGHFSPCRRVEAIRPLGCFRRKQEDAVPEACKIRWLCAGGGSARILVRPGHAGTILGECQIDLSAIGVKRAGSGFCDRRFECRTWVCNQGPKLNGLIRRCLL